MQRFKEKNIVFLKGVVTALFFLPYKLMSNFVLNKNQINNVVVTVSERSQLLDPYFLIVFRNKFSTEDVETKCSLRNGVAFNMRYDLFVIHEKVAPVALNGEVHLIEGEWSYEVYESANATLNIASTTQRVLQRGFIIVK
jgi:hypothetical protein